MSKYICVFNAFDQKDALKERGYRWHADSKSWHKLFEDNEIDEECAEVEALGVNSENIKTITESGLKKLKPMPRKTAGFPPVQLGDHYVLVRNSFSVKDELKADGYKYHSDKKAWFKNFDSKDDAEAEAQKILEKDGVEEENVEVE